jgi:hypothetical protein
LVPPLFSITLFNGDREVWTVKFTKPAPNTIVRPFNHRASSPVAAYDLFGTKCNADTTSFTPVPKNCLIIQVFNLYTLFLFGCTGFIGNDGFLGGLFGPFLGGAHGLYLNGVASAAFPMGAIF